MRAWNSATDDLTLKDGSVVKEYTIRFVTTEREVYKRIEKFFQSLIDEKDEPQTSKIIEAYSRGYADGANTIKQTFVSDGIVFAEMDEPRSNARKFLGYDCETCKHRDEEWDSESCDGCCENDDHYEPQTDCSWK